MAELRAETNGTQRIGVYICHCGTNIAGTVDVNALAEYAAALPGVALAREYKYMCSDPGQELIKQDIREHKLNRLVVGGLLPAASREHVPQSGGRGRSSTPTSSRW